jgi:hypothetical protein
MRNSSAAHAYFAESLLLFNQIVVALVYMILTVF